MTSKSVGLVLATAMLFAVAPSAFAATPVTWYVDANVSGGTGDGLSLANATTTIQAAIAAANPGDTINVAAGTYALDSQIRITKGLTIIGAGDSTVITTGGSSWTNSTGSKGYAPLITISGVSDPVVLQDLKVTGAKNIAMTGPGAGKTDFGHGINVVSSSNVTLNNVTSTSNAAAGLIVNSSNVTADNLNTSGNGWYSVNVDQQASGAASFTLTGTGVLGDNIQIDSDKTTGSTVTADGYTPYKQADGPATLWTNKPLASLSGVISITKDGTSTLYATIPGAVAAAAAGDTVNIGAGTYKLSAQLNVSNPISIVGVGSVTIQANNASWGTTNETKHLIDVTAGTGTTTLENLTLDSNSQAYGLQFYTAPGVLNSVTIENSKGAGLTVNGSTVTAANLNTSGNAWGSVNVDPGSGVTLPSVFTLNGGMLTGGQWQIWSDGSHVTGGVPEVTVHADGYTMYKIASTSAFFVWSNHTPANVATIDSTIYPTIASAIAAATDGDTVNVGSGTYTGVQLTRSYNSNIIVDGGSAADTTINGLDLSGSTFNGLTFKNFTITGDATRGAASVEIESPGTYSNLTFNNDTFDGANVAGRRAIISNQGFDGFMLTGNTFKNYADVTSGGTAYSVVFMEAQDPTWGDTYIATGNTLIGSNLPNFLEAYRWKNVSYTDNTVNADNGRLLVWSDTQRGALESLGTIDISGNNLTIQSGKAIQVYNATSTTANIANNTVNGGDYCVVLDSTSNSVVIGNTLNACSTAVLVSEDADVTAETASITSNSFSRNTTTVDNETALSLDASSNWWGNASSTVFASSIVGNVNSSPWYLNPDRTVLSNAVSGDGSVDSSGGDFTVLGSSGTADLPDGVTSLTLGDDGVLDLSSATSSDTGSQVIGGNTVNLTQAVTLNSGVSGSDVVLGNANLSGVTASIPDGTKISGPAEWDGTIAAPTATTVAGTVPSGFSVGGTAITIGSSAGTLVFNNPVTLVLKGVTGAVGYKPAGSDTWTQITTVCDSYDTPTDPGYPNECAISNGTDTKIVTHHFTTYGALTVSAPVISPNGAVSRGAIQVTIDDISGTTVHYTTDGTDPTCSSTQYTGPLSLSVAFLKAIRCDSLGNQSAISSATFAQSGGGGGGGGGSIAATPATPATPTVSPAAPATPATPAQGQVLGAAGYKFTLALATGSKNADVTALQQYLTTNGYYSGPVTGYFGSLTRAAVVAFQKARGIAQTGTVGPLTRAALNENVAETTGSSGTAAAAGAKLTVAQVNAILNVLQSFGADADVIAKVKAALGQ